MLDSANNKKWGNKKMIVVGKIFQMLACFMMFIIGNIYINMMSSTLVSDFGNNNIDLFFFYTALFHYGLGGLGLIYITITLRKI